MENWQRSLANAIESPEELADHFKVDVVPLKKISSIYPMRITRHYLGLIKRVGDPIWRQCVPDPLELEDVQQSPDPLDEERLSPVPGLIHRYPDRVVWLVSTSCSVYCRFCMRKRNVGCKGRFPGAELLDKTLDYIDDNHQIRDVILSGGDPLLLQDDLIDDILMKLRRIPHVEIVRIGTRVPVTFPDRITKRLCRLLKKHHPLFINTHFNHPAEITEQSSQACNMLADAGIPLGNQTVLLRGVNDGIPVMKLLMQLLLTIRVRPYYIHQMDLVRGTGHFRTGIDEGLKIMNGLRGHTSGLATPYYVVDLPGGKGKVPLIPEQVVRNGNSLQFRNYLNERIEYTDMD
jgi:lysine 2,3-aminomutase